MAGGREKLIFGMIKEASKYNGKVNINSGKLEKNPRINASERVLIFFARNSRTLADERVMKRAVPGPLR